MSTRTPIDQRARWPPTSPSSTHHAEFLLSKMSYSPLHSPCRSSPTALYLLLLLSRHDLYETNSLVRHAPFLFAKTDVVKTRVQAAQAEAVGRHTAAARSASAGPLEPCDKCRQQGRPYTTSARLASAATLDSVGAPGVYTSTSNNHIPLPRERPLALPSGTIAALHHIARWEGPRGLYRGLDVSLLMAIPSTVLYYTVYDDFLWRLEAAGAGKFLSPITAGSTARILATVCMAPLELVRTRIQSERSVASAVKKGVESGSYGVKAERGSTRLGRLPLASVGRAVTTVVREEGAAALWRGVGTTMWRDVPFSMVYWLGYENLKNCLGCGRGEPASEGGVQRGERSGDGLGVVEDKGRGGGQRGSADFLMRSFTAGAISGVVSSLLTHPFDVVKTQQQVVFQSVDGESRVARGVSHMSYRNIFSRVCSTACS